MRSGYYTRDAAAAQAAADKYGVAVTPTTYNGQSGWYLVDRAQRPTQEGNSGADEGLLSDADYAIIQKLKQDFSDAQAQYNAAVASGNTAAAAAAQQAMDNAHLEAERIRAGYNYSGGQDGSMYIDYYMNALSGKMPANTEQTKNLLSAKGLWSEEEEVLPSKGGSGGISGGDIGDSGGSGSGTMTGGGNSTTVPTADSLRDNVNDYSQYLEEMYAAQKAAALAELKNAYEKNINAINRAGEGISSSYQSARNETAGASELSARNFAEYAAASGLNNGAGGQAELARNVTLQNNMNYLNTKEAQAISDLELQRANAETEYNNAIAQAEAEGNYQLAAALYQEKVRYDNAMIDAIQQEYQNAVTKYQLEYQQERDLVGDSKWQQEFDLQKQQYADSLDLQKQQINFQQQQYTNSLAQAQQSSLAQYGQAFLQQGIMPSAEMLSAMGITTQDAQNYISYVQAAQGITGSAQQTVQLPSQQTAQSASLISSDTGSPASANPVRSISYNNGGLTSSQVKQLQAALGVSQDGYYGPATKSAAGGLDADTAYSRYVSGVGDAAGFSSVRNTNGVKASEWDMIKNNIVQNLRNGNYQAAESYLDLVAGGMSDSQANEIAQIMEQYGYSGITNY